MSNELYLKPKMGLVPELSIQNYETLAKQFREYISNSMDAGAREVQVSFSRLPTGPEISIRDDGQGMSVTDLKEQFLAIGGSQKHDDPTKVGRIGIGFLAMVPLCKSIQIFSRRKGSKEAFSARLDCEKLTSAGLRVEDMGRVPIGYLEEVVVDPDTIAALPDGFCQIKLVGINKATESTLFTARQYSEFEKQLRTILPLPYPDEHRLYEYLSGEMVAELHRLSAKHSLKVYVNSELPLARRLYGELATESFAFVKEYINTDVGEKLRMSGYIICADQTISKDWPGMVTRVLNVAVEDEGFLRLKGNNARKRRVTGDIHLIGLDKKAITINRNQLIDGHVQFESLKGFVHRELTKQVFRGMDIRWDVASKVNKELKGIENLRTAVQRAFGAITDRHPKQPARPALRPKQLSGLPEAEALPNRVAVKGPKGTTVNLKIHRSKIGKQRFGKHYTLSLNQNGTSGMLTVDEGFLQSVTADIQLYGKGFKTRFVLGQASGHPCEIDFVSHEVRLNMGHPAIAAKDPRLIELLLFVAYADATTDSKSAFRDRLLELISASV